MLSLTVCEARSKRSWYGIAKGGVDEGQLPRPRGLVVKVLEVFTLGIGVSIT